MSKGLLILSIILMAGAAVLGWLTRDKVTTMKSDLDTARTKLTSTNMQLTQAEGKAKAAQDEATKAKADLDAKDKELVDEKSKSATAEAMNKQLQETITTKDTEIAGLNKTIADMKPAGVAVNIPELQAKLKDAEAKAQEKETLLETVTSKVKNLEEESKGLRNKVAQYEQKSMRPGIEGTVMAVNQGWNFVVVDIGDKKGVAMGAELIVKREGLRIATVKVTSVEPNTSVADIVAGSVARGMHVQPGDRVIFEKGS